MRATADFSAQACGKGSWADTGVLTGEFSAHRIKKARSERKNAFPSSGDNLLPPTADSGSAFSICCKA